MSEKQKDINLVFLEAVEKPTTKERTAYLDEVCRDNAALRSDLESLLRAHEKAGGFLETPIFESNITLDSSPISEVPGTVVGHFKLLEKIGEGGMAVVYMAEQETPIRRKVALKIIKLGMDTKSVIARFEAERQALAMMDHPNIAKVLDAGATETGRPYFVMELVTGVSITEYCDINNLNTKDRLTLFIQVCNAVQHAHQKGIIHRDIKPTNVMVTLHDGKPVPKVIDFGIAKAINQKLTEKTLFTRYAHIIGTPTYMSPEQAELSDLDVDTRTDIYSLGVLLYELLTGTLPFSEEELRKAGYIEMQRIIREQEPVKPSTKLSTLGGTLTDVAKHRNSTPDLLRKAIRGDLDWIVMKSLEKDRSRRYETAHGLAEDIERHVKHEPVLAGSPGTIYRLQKFLRRHRSHLVATAAATTLLAALIFGTTEYVQNRRIRWARNVALPEIVKLIEQDDYLAAFSLAIKAEKFIPKDPMLAELWPHISRDFSIITTPASAKVYYKEYSDIESEWQYLGRSPLESIRFPRGVYRWKIEKDGFETRECVAGDSLSIQLPEQDGVPPGMAPIPAWTANIGLASSGQTETVEAPAYLIDKYEVTNEQFEQFVDSVGYKKRQYWKQPFIKDGQELSWEQAVSQFRDKTGQHGPATWERGTYPKGQGKHPVSGVSWYEAAAYAEFVGKSLPTVYHWQQAACLDESLVIVPHSNFAMEGTVPVGSYIGMGHTGLYDMAGNVKEWCFNTTDDLGNQRYILGGGWGEPTYLFTDRDSRSPWDRSPLNGFRCVQYPEGEDSVATKLFDSLGQRLLRDYSTEVPCSDVEYQILKRQFEYDRTPLNPVVESIDRSSPFWRKEKITFDAAYGGERVIVYLFIPKAVHPPYQAVVYWPDGTAPLTPAFKGLPQRDSTELIITSGRALLFPVLKGTYERRHAKMPDVDETPVIATDWVIQMSKDLRRSVDYLETRADIDKGRIAYYGVSSGGLFASMSLAVEDRFKAAVLVSGGFPTGYVLPPAIDPINHAPKVRTPVLMVNGKEDSVFPYETSQRPMYELLGTDDEHKQHKLYPGGHGLGSLFSKQIRGDVLYWLDRYLGPVDVK
jgi:serine/threonine protein kinase/formylglycine-generating enzyme required for sulfatase activity/dienelactone hydrolase